MMFKATSYRSRAWLGAGIFSVIAVSAWLTSPPQAQAPSNTVPRYAPNGDLLAPDGFETWVFVGSNLGLAYSQNLPVMTALEAKRADAPQFHNVYINKEAYDQFVATGEFPIPTILVMQKFAAADKEPRGSVLGRRLQRRSGRAGSGGEEPAPSRPQHHGMGLLRPHRSNRPI